MWHFLPFSNKQVIFGFQTQLVTMAKSCGLLNSICARLTNSKVPESDAMDTETLETAAIDIEHSDTDKENNNEPHMDNKEQKEVKEIWDREPHEDPNKAEEPCHTPPLSRKNRRKNLKPMNIAQLDNYEEEDLETGEDFSYLRNEDGTSPAKDDNILDLSSHPNYNGDHDSNDGDDIRDNCETRDTETNPEDFDVLDLSIAKSDLSIAKPDLSIAKPEEAPTEKPQRTTSRQEMPDAAALKDYAQSTMNELLSLYGLSGEEAESIAGSVPLQNFSSGKILERQRAHVPVPPRAHLKLALDKSHPGAPHLPASPVIGSGSPAIGSRSSSPMTGSGASSPSSSMSNDVYAKMLDRVTQGREILLHLRL